VANAEGSIITPAKSADTLHALMQLRCRQEILERWLASQIIPNGLQQGLRAMLTEVEEQLRVFSGGFPR